ncbi:unnamed protein product [Brassica oleracea var. botrytis]|uniref:Uncharacterized protein n=1 Tax=Brassica oleracea TaxID=3712 RepID=A0A3P6BQ42_BRAOL|nr:unnamed protein product [Brassica oleracea]
MLWRLEKEKKTAKVLTTISKKLYLLSSIGFSHDPDDGLVAEIQNKTISVRILVLFTQEATYILFKQLDRLGTVEKLLKKQRKEEANVKAMKRMTEITDVRMNSYKTKPIPILESLYTNKLDAHSCKNTGEAVKLALLQSAAAPTTFPSTVNHGWTMKTVEAVPKVGLALKRVEVCM